MLSLRAAHRSDLLFREPRSDGSIDFSDAKSGILKETYGIGHPRGEIHLCVSGLGKSKHFSKMAADPVSGLPSSGTSAFLKSIGLTRHGID